MNFFQFFSIFFPWIQFFWLIYGWPHSYRVTKLIMGYLRMLGMTNKQKKIINFFLYFQYISFDQTFHFFNNNSLTKSSLRVQKFINWPKKGISQENIGKKFLIFFWKFLQFFEKIPRIPQWNILIKSNPRYQNVQPLAISKSSIHGQILCFYALFSSSEKSI